MDFKLPALSLVLILASVNGVSAKGPGADPGKLDPTIKHLNTSLNRSGKDYRVTIRITSLSDAKRRSVVFLNAARDADPLGDTLRFQINGDNTEAQELCLHCLPSGGVSTCEPGTSASLPEPQSTFPGSILPWEEVLVGACANWVTEKSPSASTAERIPQQLYQVRLANPAFDYSWANTLVTIDADSRDPVYFDRVDPEGLLMRRIRVLEIGATGSWRGIRRATIELPKGRVLMEVVGFRLGAGKISRSE